MKWCLYQSTRTTTWTLHCRLGALSSAGIHPLCQQVQILLTLPCKRLSHVPNIQKPSQTIVKLCLYQSTRTTTWTFHCRLGALSSAGICPLCQPCQTLSTLSGKGLNHAPRITNMFITLDWHNCACFHFNVNTQDINLSLQIRGSVFGLAASSLSTWGALVNLVMQAKEWTMLPTSKLFTNHTWTTCFCPSMLKGPMHEPCIADWGLCLRLGFILFVNRCRFCWPCHTKRLNQVPNIKKRLQTIVQQMVFVSIYKDHYMNLSLQIRGSVFGFASSSLSTWWSLVNLVMQAKEWTMLPTSKLFTNHTWTAYFCPSMLKGPVHEPCVADWGLCLRLGFILFVNRCRFCWPCHAKDWTMFPTSKNVHKP